MSKLFQTVTVFLFLICLATPQPARAGLKEDVSTVLSRLQEVLTQLAVTQSQTAAVFQADVIEGDYIASDPSVIKDGSVYRMFYTCLIPPTRTAICQKTSSDGETWENLNGSPTQSIVLQGVDGEWDENLESAGAIKVNDTYFLYYSGYTDIGDPLKGFPASLGISVSTDGENFFKGGIVMSPTTDGFDNDAVYSPDIIYDVDQGALVMAYAGHSYCATCSVGNRILAAVSADGYNWTKQSTPLLEANGGVSWMADGVAEPALIKQGDVYYLFFTGLAGADRNIGLATSNSALGPYSLVGTEPVISPSGNHDLVLAPTVLYENETFRTWFLTAAGDALSISYLEDDFGVIDTTAPTLTLTGSIATSSTDTTPSFSFTTTEAGTIVYSGNCSASDTLASIGTNTITLDALTPGTYSNCAVTVTDAAGNASASLSLGTFVIETEVLDDVGTTVQTNQSSGGGGSSNNSIVSDETEKVTTANQAIRLTATSNLNVRTTPGGALLTMVPLGTTGEQLTFTPVSQGGYTWIKVRFDNGTEGYVADSFLTTDTPTTSSSLSSERRTEILALITTLLAQIHVLQEQLEARTSGTATVPPSTVASACNVTTPFLSRDLYFGLSGSDVSTFQRFLTEHGYYNDDITGYFGSVTKAATQAYQRANDIPDLGGVGPATRDMVHLQVAKCSG